MENTYYLPSLGLHSTRNYRWNIYKSLHTSRWIVWNKAWSIMTEPLRFDTWQEAMDYVNRGIVRYE